MLGHHLADVGDGCHDTDGHMAHINTLEIWPVIAAADRWSATWDNRNGCVITDNTQVLFAINTGRSKNKTDGLA